MICEETLPSWPHNLSTNKERQIVTKQTNICPIFRPSMRSFTENATNNLFLKQIMYNKQGKKQEEINKHNSN